MVERRRYRIASASSWCLKLYDEMRYELTQADKTTTKKEKEKERRKRGEQSEAESSEEEEEKKHNKNIQ